MAKKAGRRKGEEGKKKPEAWFVSDPLPEDLFRLARASKSCFSSVGLPLSRGEIPIPASESERERKWGQLTLKGGLSYQVFGKAKLCVWGLDKGYFLGVYDTPRPAQQ